MVVLLSSARQLEMKPTDSSEETSKPDIRVTEGVIRLNGRGFHTWMCLSHHVWIFFYTECSLQHTSYHVLSCHVPDLLLHHV